MLYQKQTLSKDSAQEINYWQQQLEGIAPLLHFPTVRVREVVSTSEAEIESNLFTLERDLSPRLKSIAQQHNVYLPVILLSAFQVLLYRYTNQENIVVSCLDWCSDRLLLTEADCSQKKLEMLPIKVTLNEQQNVSELLAIIQTKILEASNFSNISIEKITEALKKNAEFEGSSLSQMLFRFRSLSTTSQVKLTESEEASLTEAGFFATTKIPGRELLLDIIETPQGLNCKIEYDRHLFDASTIQRLAQNYQVLLSSIVANPQTAIGSLSLISTAEQQQVLKEWNQTQTESTPQCIHQLFEAQVQQNPEAVAIICQGQELTYGELNAQANQLARYLQTLGVTRQSLVGLCLERSLFMVVGVFAILKAGGAYVPLDITNPLEIFELIKRHGVTIVDHVPSFWRNFWGILNQQSSARRKSLLDNQVRLVAAGGEQVTPEIYQCWRETFKPHVQLANIYGQTEGTGVVTV